MIQSGLGLHFQSALICFLGYLHRLIWSFGVFLCRDNKCAASAGTRAESCVYLLWLNVFCVRRFRCVLCCCSGSNKRLDGPIRAAFTSQNIHVSQDVLSTRAGKKIIKNQIRPFCKDLMQSTNKYGNSRGVLIH